MAAAGGLAGFLIFAQPGGGNESPSNLGWLVAGSICGGAVVLTVGLALRGPRWWRAAMFGAAGAIGFAFTAALVKKVGDYVAGDWIHMFSHWQTYALAVCGVASLFLAQNAFHAGPIAASQTALVLVDPLASMAIGIGLFGDNLRTAGAYGPLEALSLLIMFAGAAFVAQSPLISGMKGDDQQYTEMLSLAVALQALGRRGAGHPAPRRLRPPSPRRDPAPAHRLTARTGPGRWPDGAAGGRRLSRTTRARWCPTRHEPQAATARPAAISTPAASRGTDTDVPAGPTVHPVRNRGASSATEDHQVTVPASTTAVATVTPRASAPQARTTRPGRSR